MGAIIGIIIYLAILFAIIGGFWKIFEKAGKPGWASIVPIYNIVVLLEMVGKPTWWLVLFLIPLANIYAAFVVYTELAKAFGKTSGFGIGMLFLPIIFIPMLGFGDAEYQGGNVDELDHMVA